jgi:hypothetical protein
MHEINLNNEIHFYIDAFVFATDMTVTQFRLDHIEKIVKISIIYDSFSFSLSWRKYLTYKKELYVIITFVTKYDYLCKHFYKSAIIHTDHRSLTHFLKSNVHENIYDHWADQLRRLNIVIKYISDSRNKIVDDLFKILFFDEDCCQATFHSTVKLWCLYSRIACKVVYFTLCIFLGQFGRVVKLFTRSRLTECKVSQSFRSEFKFTGAQPGDLTRALDDWKWLRYD